MSKRPAIAPALLGLNILGALLITGCGGGGSLGGIEGTGDTVTTSGTVTGFGSVWVNGQRYDTEDASIFIDGEQRSETALAPGMIVRIDGIGALRESYAASTVTASTQLRGEISALSPANAIEREMTVLGQTVQVNEDSFFAQTAFDQLAVGSTIAVNGFVSDSGIRATRIAELTAAPLSVSVEGFIDRVDEPQAQIHINQLTVDLSQAVLDNSSLAALNVGHRVRVWGEFSAETGVLQALRLTRVEHSTKPIPAGSLLSVEGLIEGFNSLASFRVGELPVNGQGAQVERGSQDSLGEAVRVAVTGMLDTQGQLQAQVIRLLLPSDTRFRGHVEAVEDATQRIRLLGTEFELDELTSYQDQGPERLRELRFANINPGDSLEIFARRVDGRWLASQVRRLDDLQGTVSFRGPVGEVISAGEFLVTGIRVDARSAEIVNEAALAPGQFVNVEGMADGERRVMATRVRVLDTPSCAAPVGGACDDESDESDANDDP